MNSLERHEARYRRRKTKREKIIIDRSELYANLDRTFTFSKVMYYADKCCNRVGYKKSTQYFKLHMFTIIATTCRKIKTNNYKVGKTYKFRINERGKIRDIDAPYIKDRLVHKVLSNEILLPLYYPHIIYDNGASMKNKGFLFSINRVKYKLYNWYHKYGMIGFVVLIDFSKFFENCSHEVIHEIHKKYIHDDYVIKVIEDYLFIGKGIALGVEIAQREACIIPNILDHFLQNNGVKLVRYMDDSFFIVRDYKDAKVLLERYFSLATKYHLKINKFKTKIISIYDSFKYCKWIYHVDDNGKVIVVADKSIIYRQRRKIRKMNNRKVDTEETKSTINSFVAYLSIGNNYKCIKKLRTLQLAGNN